MTDLSTDALPNALEIARRPDAVRYFASGSNRSGEVRGLGRVELNVGVSALEVTARATRDYPLNDGTVARCSVALPVFDELLELPEASALFVDSGAFSEVCFHPTSRRTSSGFAKSCQCVDRSRPQVVRPMDAQTWSRVIGFQCRVAGRLGERAYIVAPDRVACQRTTLERLERHANALRQMSALGANILVPVQRGELDLVAFFRRACDLIGILGEAIPAIPMKKAATSLEDLVAFVAEVQPRAIHLLGLGPKSRRWPRVIAALRAIAPDMEILADSVILRSIVGRTNGPSKGPRALTAAMDRVEAANPELDPAEARARAIQLLADTPAPSTEDAQPEQKDLECPSLAEHAAPAPFPSGGAPDAAPSTRTFPRPPRRPNRLRLRSSRSRTPRSIARAPRRFAGRSPASSTTVSRSGPPPTLGSSVSSPGPSDASRSSRSRR